MAWLGWRFWENSLGHKTLALKIGAVFAPAGIAGLVYWLMALAFKIPAAKEMTEFALAKFRTVETPTSASSEFEGAQLDAGAYSNWHHRRPAILRRTLI